MTEISDILSQHGISGELMTGKLEGNAADLINAIRAIEAQLASKRDGEAVAHIDRSLGGTCISWHITMLPEDGTLLYAHPPANQGADQFRDATQVTAELQAELAKVREELSLVKNQFSAMKAFAEANAQESEKLRATNKRLLIANLPTAREEYELQIELTALRTEVAQRDAELAALREQAERDSMQKCLYLINAHIKQGHLTGNGLDQSAERNGLILASNIVSAAIDKQKEQK
jgi:hypothetical protein